MTSTIRFRTLAPHDGKLKCKKAGLTVRMIISKHSDGHFFSISGLKRRFIIATIAFWFPVSEELVFEKKHASWSHVHTIQGFLGDESRTWLDVICTAKVDLAQLKQRLANAHAKPSLPDQSRNDGTTDPLENGSNPFSETPIGRTRFARKTIRRVLPFPLSVGSLKREPVRRGFFRTVIEKWEMCMFADIFTQVQYMYTISLNVTFAFKCSKKSMFLIREHDMFSWVIQCIWMLHNATVASFSSQRIDFPSPRIRSPDAQWWSRPSELCWSRSATPWCILAELEQLRTTPVHSSPVNVGAEGRGVRGTCCLRWVLC